jgi:REP element-mobilizing transposase RayT
MIRARQLSLLPRLDLRHGGVQRAGKRKTFRPLDPKRPLHVVLKSSRARGAWSLLAHERVVKTTLDRTARKHGVRVLQFVNVGNHLHLNLRFRKRENLQRFFKEFAGRVAFSITGARKTQARGRFWDHTLFTRIVEWGRDFAGLNRYFTKNFFEAYDSLFTEEEPP